MKRILTLVAVVVALLAAVLVLRHREEERARVDRAEARLLSFGDRDVTAVVVTVDGVRWRFEPGDQGWRVTEPVADAAGEDAINQLIAAANRVAVTRVIDDPEALSAYGLDPPVASVRFEGPDEVLDLGTVTPTGDGVFARVEGRAGVLVLEATVVTAASFVEMDPNRFRDPGFFTIARTNITAIAIASRAGEMAVEPRPDGWWITEPRTLPASDEQVARLLDALEQTTVRGFLDDADPNSAEIGLGAGAMRIEVTAGGSVRRFAIGARTENGQRFATRDDRDTVLAIDGPGFDSLTFDLQSAATRRLSRVNRYRVDRFTYRKGDASVSAERIADQWASGDGAPLPAEGVYEFLVAALEMPVSGWSVAAGGSRPPTAELRYRLEDGAEGFIRFLPEHRAQISEAPDVVFLLTESAPAVPSF